MSFNNYKIEGCQSQHAVKLVDLWLGSYPSSLSGEEDIIVKCTKLPQAGGDRHYYRLFCENLSPVSVIGVVADNLRDSRAFVELSRIFDSENINVPTVLAVSSNYKFYIESDLGNISMLDFIQKNRDNNFYGIEEKVCQMMEMLVSMQCVSRNRLEKAIAYPEFSYRQAMWDLNYFKYEFLKVAGITFDENLLENDFELLASNLVDSDRSLWGFMMRDCQSRNVMLYDGEIPYFIDYQGGRFGPVLYDAISFLWQSKAGFTSDFRNKMLKKYAERYSSLKGIEESVILNNVGLFALFRTLQVLGAYGFRGLVEKRSHFIESIPGALANLKDLINKGTLESYPELKRACETLIELPKFKDNSRSLLYPGALTVTVFSFSYKKGYPEDLSGNGGGFMFDCRGMHNPGRYEEYKSLTGRDGGVIQFLEDRGEVQMFVKRAFELVSPSIERYIQRGFKSLQIGFGCTGGQHRSVYCAEKVAHLIHNMWPEINVILIHREQNINEQI